MRTDVVYLVNLLDMGVLCEVGSGMNVFLRRGHIGRHKYTEPTAPLAGL